MSWAGSTRRSSQLAKGLWPHCACTSSAPQSVGLMNNCSTSRCHGGSNSGRLRLLQTGAATDRVRYTNLLILDRFRTKEGVPLLDWEQPEQSLLVQYGLPRSETTTPHPAVKGWKPLFTGRQRSMKDGAALWMNSMMQSPRPEYPIGELTDDGDRLPR